MTKEAQELDYLASSLRTERIALVFDDLMQYGGAERLLLDVLQLFPNAHLFTTCASDKWLERLKRLGIPVHLSFMQRLPFKTRLNRFYSILGLHILAIESFRLASFDLVLSISARYAHGVLTKPTQVHICYMNSPGRMFWEASTYFEHESRLLRALWRILLGFLHHVRLWDFTASQRVDYFIANSPVPQARIERYYRRKSSVVFPPVHLPEDPSIYDIPRLKSENYFLILTRLQAWKRVDLAINALVGLDFKLKIAGAGVARGPLERLASSVLVEGQCEFLGFVTDRRKFELLRNARALVVTQEEDFGISMVEALSVGCPVIAYGVGGATHIIEPGKTGVFFDRQLPSSLRRVLADFDPHKFSAETCIKASKRFSVYNFHKALLAELNRVYFKKI